MLMKNASAYFKNNLRAARSLVTFRRLGIAAGGSAGAGGLWWLTNPAPDAAEPKRPITETRAGTPLVMASVFAVPFIGAAISRRFPQNKFLKGLKF